MTRLQRKMELFRSGRHLTRETSWEVTKEELLVFRKKSFYSLILFSIVTAWMPNFSLNGQFCSESLWRILVLDFDRIRNCCWIFTKVLGRSHKEGDSLWKKLFSLIQFISSPPIFSFAKGVKNPRYSLKKI